jgi:hypothetical protein
VECQRDNENDIAKVKEVARQLLGNLQGDQSKYLIMSLRVFKS